MPITYRYDEHFNRLTTRCEGVVSFADVAEHFRQLRCDARLRPHCGVLLELSFLAHLPSAGQVDEVVTIIESGADLVSFGRCALIAREGVAYDLSRMFQGLAWPLFRGIRVFRNESDAITWLNEDA